MEKQNTKKSYIIFPKIKPLNIEFINDAFPFISLGAHIKNSIKENTQNVKSSFTDGSNYPEAFLNDRVDLNDKYAKAFNTLKKSKSASDQARLLRVIERERQLMTELREREIQRTEEIRQAKELVETDLKKAIEQNQSLEAEIQKLNSKYKNLEVQNLNSNKIYEDLRNVIAARSSGTVKSSSQKAIKTVIKKNITAVRYDVHKKEETSEEIKSFLNVINEEIKRLERLDNQLNEEDRKVAKAYEEKFKNLKSGYKNFLEKIENLEDTSDQDIEQAIDQISNKDKEFWDTVAGNIASPVALAASVGAVAFAWTGLTAVLLDLPMATAISTVFSPICTVGAGSAVAIHITNKVTEAIESKKA